MHRFARETQAEGEQVTFGFHPGKNNPDFPEVDLRLPSGGVFLRDECFYPSACCDFDLSSAHSNVIADRGIRQLSRRMLVHETGEDPTGGVALFTRSF